MGSGLGCGRLLAGWFALGVLAVSGFAQTQTQAGSARVSVEAGDPPAMASVPAGDEDVEVYDVWARVHREGGLPVRWLAKNLTKKFGKQFGKRIAGPNLIRLILAGSVILGSEYLAEVAIPAGRCGVDVEVSAPASRAGQAEDWAFDGNWALEVPFDFGAFIDPASTAFLRFDEAFPSFGERDLREAVRAGSVLSVTTADELSCTGATLETEFEFWQDDVVDPCDAAGGASQETATEVAVGSSVDGCISEEGEVDHYRFEVEERTHLEVYTTGRTDTFGRLDMSASDDDDGQGYNFHIEASVSDGVHYVQVSGYESETGEYTLHVRLTDSPPDPPDPPDSADPPDPPSGECLGLTHAEFSARVRGNGYSCVSLGGFDGGPSDYDGRHHDDRLFDTSAFADHIAGLRFIDANTPLCGTVLWSDPVFGPDTLIESFTSTDWCWYFLRPEGTGSSIGSCTSSLVFRISTPGDFPPTPDGFVEFAFLDPTSFLVREVASSAHYSTHDAGTISVCRQHGR